MNFASAETCSSDSDCGSNQKCITGRSICADVCPPSTNPLIPITYCDPQNPLTEAQKCVTDPTINKELCYTCINYTCVQLEQPLPPVPGTTITSFETYLKYIYQIALGIVGLTALIYIIIGGVMYMTAAGNTTQTTEAKNRIQNAILGLILALAAYLILYTINPDLVRLSKTQIEYPVLPKVILTCENNTCVSKIVNPEDVTANTINTCGEVGTVCPPSCKLRNVYWSKQEAKVGDTIKLIIQAKGLCSDVLIQPPSIYEESYGVRVPIDTNIFISKFRGGFPYYTAETNWVVKKPSSVWWTAWDVAKRTLGIAIFEGKLDYVAEISILDRDRYDEPQWYFKDSSILKVDTGKSSTTGSGGQTIPEGMVIIGDCVGRVNWDRKVAYQGDTINWNVTLNNCEGRNYKIEETLSAMEWIFGLFNSYEPFTYYDTAGQLNEVVTRPYTVENFEGKVNLQLTVDGKKSNTVSIRVTIPEVPTIQ